MGKYWKKKKHKKEKPFKEHIFEDITAKDVYAFTNIFRLKVKRDENFSNRWCSRHEKLGKIWFWEIWQGNILIINKD